MTDRSVTNRHHKLTRSQNHKGEYEVDGGDEDHDEDED